LDDVIGPWRSPNEPFLDYVCFDNKVKYESVDGLISILVFLMPKLWLIYHRFGKNKISQKVYFANSEKYHNLPYD